MKKNHKSGIIIGVLFVLISIVGLFYYFNFRDDVRKKDYVSVDGYVYDYDYRDGCEYYDGYYYDEEDETCMMAIKVEYFVSNNRYTITSSSASSYPKSIGSKVEVKYNPTNPSNAFISGKDDGDVIILVVSSLIGVVGILALFSAINGYKKS